VPASRRTTVYCESVENGIVALDTALPEHSLELLAQLSRGARTQRGFESDTGLTEFRSMFLVEGLKYRRGRGFRSGSWYELPTAFWNDVGVESVDAVDSNVLLAMVRASAQQADVSRFLVGGQYHRVPDGHSLDLPVYGKPNKLVVWDCGQGNLNELQFGNSRLFYDAGADVVWRPATVRKLLRRIRIANGGPSPLILSHWDKDHYAALLYMSSRELKSLSPVIVPAPAPGTNTVNRVLGALSRAGSTVAGVPAMPRTRATDRRIVLKRAFSFGSLEIYRATPGKSKNQTGIVIAATGSNLEVLLPGDHHYEKISKIVSRNSPLVLVVPHHGGVAGTPRVSEWTRSHFHAALSYGRNNSHKHPLPRIVRFLGACGAVCQDTASWSDLAIAI